MMMTCVPRLADLELVLDAGADRGDDRPDLLVREHLVDARLSTLMILPRSGRIAWNSRLRPCLAEPPAESPSTR